MDMSSSYAERGDEQSTYDRATVAAIFDTPGEAKAALKELHAAGFKKTWMGVTMLESTQPATDAAAMSDGFYTPTAAVNEHQVETAAGGIAGTLSRFFGQSTQQPLYAALVEQGVPSSDAFALDSLMHDGGAVITVQVDDRYEAAIEILQRDREADRSDAPSSGVKTAAVAAAAVAATAIAAVAASAIAAAKSKPEAAQTLNERQTFALQEEQLAIDKEQVPAGQATVHTTVVSEVESADVPVMHEELFVARRPVADGAVSASGTIEAQTVVVPLMREQVVVDKRTVVREEVAVGKRQVPGVERVSDVVRHEELVVDDPPPTITPH